jgi:hypothetical protein
VDTFLASSFGFFVMTLFQGILTTPSWQTFTYLACGWTLARDRHTITTYLWLTGATTAKHFSRFYVFLGCPLYDRRWQLWAAVIRQVAQVVPDGEVIRVIFDDSTKKKAGRQIEGVGRYRNGAGSARQAYRTLQGLHFVLGIMPIPRKWWPGHRLSIPIGFELYLKPEQAQELGVPYRSRSQLARDILNFVAEQLPKRHIRSVADGGYSTRDYGRDLPESTHVVGRFPISSKLYELPSKPTKKRRGAPRKQGDLIGSPKTLAKTETGWSPHPSEAGTEVRAWCGLWHAVWPGRLLQVVVVRRNATRGTNAVDGLGQDQCRKRQRIIGANTFRLVMAAARTLWFLEQVERGVGVNLGRYRPWYRQKCAPSQLDVVWACREVLHEAGIFPIPRFTPDLAENHEEPDHALPLAA